MELLQAEDDADESEKLLLLFLSQEQKGEAEGGGAAAAAAEEDEGSIAPIAAASALLGRLLHLSRSPSHRALLAARLAVPRLLPLLPSHLSRPRTLSLLLKLLRNLCAGDPSNQRSFLQSDGVSSVAFVVTEILEAGFENFEANGDREDGGGGGGGGGGDPREHGAVGRWKADGDAGLQCAVLRIALQLLGNVCGAGEAQREAVWKAFFPATFRALVATVRRYGELSVMEPLCMVIYTCSHGVRERLMDLCQGEGAWLISECIRSCNEDSGTSDSSSNEWISFLLSEICLKEPLLPHLFMHIGGLWRLSSLKMEFSEKRAEVSFSSEQVTLLGYVVDLLRDELNEGTFVTDEIQLPLPRESLRHLTDLIQVIAKEFMKCESAHQMCPSMVAVLQKLLELFKMLAACEQGFRHLITTELLSNGFISLCLELLKDLGPPELIQKAIEKHGEVELTTNNGKICVSKRSISPYKGYRKDIIAILANLSYKNRYVQDEIRNLGGLPLILQQCVVDEDNPFLREWGFWAIRNLLEDNIENAKEISEMQLKGSVTPIELEQRGYKVEMDQAAGRPKLLNISPPKQ